MAVALQLLTAVDFQSHVGEDFFIHFTGEVTSTAQLDKVVDLPAYNNRERKPFSVLFQTTQKNHHYQQAIYTIEQPCLGTMEIFLVPVGRNEKGVQYEAVFS
jgi:hypothetical protein